MLLIRNCDILFNDILLFISGKGAPPIKPLDQILITLKYLTHGEVYRMVASTCGVNTSSVHKIVERVMELILEHLMPQYITWPSVQRQRQLARYYEELRHFPGVIGSIDCTHVWIPRPTAFQKDYHCKRKERHTVVMQVLFLECDVNISVMFIVGLQADLLLFDRSRN